MIRMILEGLNLLHTFTELVLLLCCYVLYSKNIKLNASNKKMYDIIVERAKEEIDNPV